jgi:hypothetical protein
MDWMKTNHSPVEDWAGRPKTNDYAFTSRGLPLELLIDLANRMHAHPWFCMPHGADDEYIRRAAHMALDRLDPDLRVYVEYSNEVHNPTFVVHRYALARGKELKLLPSDEASAMPDWKTDRVIRHRYQGLRTTEMARIWKNVFSDQGDRVVIVITGTHDSDLMYALDFRDTAKWVDMIATCSYWGFGMAGKLPKPLAGTLTVDSMFAALEKDLDEKMGTRCAEISGLARRYGKPLALYEGGQHLSRYGGGYKDLPDEDRDVLLDVSLRCQRDPRMGRLMQKDFDLWFDTGAELYCIFSHIYPASGAFAWGLWEYQGQPLDEAVKARAVYEYLDRHANPE